MFSHQLVFVSIRLCTNFEAFCGCLRSILRVLGCQLDSVVDVRRGNSTTQPGCPGCHGYRRLRDGVKATARSGRYGTGDVSFEGASRFLEQPRMSCKTTRKTERRETVSPRRSER